MGGLHPEVAEGEIRPVIFDVRQNIGKPRAGGLRSGAQNNGKHTVLFPKKAGSKGYPARGLTVLLREAIDRAGVPVREGKGTAAGIVVAGHRCQSPVGTGIPSDGEIGTGLVRPVVNMQVVNDLIALRLHQVAHRQLVQAVAVVIPLVELGKG